MVRVRVVRTVLLPLGAVVMLAVLALPAAGQVPSPPSPPKGTAPDRAQADPNPCIGADAARLLCPDLVMRRPYGLYTDRLTKAGSTVLRAGNVIDSVGRGPAELRGERATRRSMQAYQRIHTVGGGLVSIDTNARLQFKFAHQQRYWWKFYDAARFELWRVDSRGRRSVRVRTGPKVAYCLRDLTRTRPRLRRSPRRPVYPACSTNRRAESVTLGTSPGWADIYPPAYPEQWIDVTGLRGCFAYVHIADPENGIYESNEDNNEAQTIVRLPFDAKRRREGCKGSDRGRTFDPRDDYYTVG
jgi:Lysyl oxidase